MEQSLADLILRGVVTLEAALDALEPARRSSPACSSAPASRSTLPPDLSNALDEQPLAAGLRVAGS